jgi:hypothetical protein
MTSFTPWGVPLTTWKAILDPTAPGGNYTVVAECTAGCDAASTPPINISNVAFGDVWCVVPPRAKCMNVFRKEGGNGGIVGNNNSNHNHRHKNAQQLRLRQRKGTAPGRATCGSPSTTPSLATTPWRPSRPASTTTSGSWRVVAATPPRAGTPCRRPVAAPCSGRALRCVGGCFVCVACVYVCGSGPRRVCVAACSCGVLAFVQARLGPLMQSSLSWSLWRRRCRRYHRRHRRRALPRAVTTRG